MAAVVESYSPAYQLAYLLVGEPEGAVQALVETLRSTPFESDAFWAELAVAALRVAQNLSPDRFFLRSLGNPVVDESSQLRYLVDRLPEAERTALVLDVCSPLTRDPPQTSAGQIHLSHPKGRPVTGAPAVARAPFSYCPPRIRIGVPSFTRW
jgi:hypothetical protein